MYSTSAASAFAGHVVPGILDPRVRGVLVDSWGHRLKEPVQQEAEVKEVDNKKDILKKLQDIVKDSGKPTAEALPQYRDWR